MRHGLERALSKAGWCSRAEARRLVALGRVQVAGRVELDPCAWVDPDLDALAVDGVPVARATRRYVALHKPTGCLTTRRDPAGRPTVYDHLAGLDAFLVHAGRLDGATSGLLLFTNDTRFADRVTNPASGLEKTYVVEARPRLAAAALAQLARGVVLTDGPTRPARVELLDPSMNEPVEEPRREARRRTRFALTITEGRNRQVRRMVRAVGARVERLARVRIGPVELGDLPPGAWRDLTAREVAAIWAAAPTGDRAAPRSTEG